MEGRALLPDVSSSLLGWAREALNSMPCVQTRAWMAEFFAEPWLMVLGTSKMRGTYQVHGLLEMLNTLNEAAPWVYTVENICWSMLQSGTREQGTLPLCNAMGLIEKSGEFELITTKDPRSLLTDPWSANYHFSLAGMINQSSYQEHREHLDRLLRGP